MLRISSIRILELVTWESIWQPIFPLPFIDRLIFEYFYLRAQSRCLEMWPVCNALVALNDRWLLDVHMSIFNLSWLCMCFDHSHWSVSCQFKQDNQDVFLKSTCPRRTHPSVLSGHNRHTNYFSIVFDMLLFALAKQMWTTENSCMAYYNKVWAEWEITRFRHCETIKKGHMQCNTNPITSMYYRTYFTVVSWIALRNYELVRVAYLPVLLEKQNDILLGHLRGQRVTSSLSFKSKRFNPLKRAPHKICQDRRPDVTDTGSNSVCSLIRRVILRIFSYPPSQGINISMWKHLRIILTQLILILLLFFLKKLIYLLNCDWYVL